MKVYATTNQYEWIKHEELDRKGGYNETSAISADGNSLILGVAEGGENYIDEVPGPLYISGNYGTTWQDVAAVADPGVNNDWISVDVSNNGQVMVAASAEGVDFDSDDPIDGKILVSEDGGDTWDNKTPADPDAGAIDQWKEIVVSGDGSKIAAIRDGDFSEDEDFVWISEDSGDSWTDVPIVVDTHYADNLKSLSISDDGSTILVGGENTSGADTKLFFTEDDGDNWLDVTPNPENGVWNNHHDISADGSKMIVSTEYFGDNLVYLFENDGITISWTDITYEGGAGTAWTDVAISDDGSTLTAVDEYDGENGKMFISRDDGNSWAEEVPGQTDEDIQFMQSIDTNQDGSRFIVAGEDYAYTNNESVSETESTVTFDNAEGGKTVTLTTPDGTTITCHSSVKESSLTVEDIAYSYPLGLVDFCFSGADATNEIRIVFVTDLKPDEVVVRKYNPANDKYTTVSEASVTETTSEGQPALEVVYNITDNGPLDTDPDVGEVADPIGLGTVDIKVPDTGIGPSEQSTSTPLAAALIGSTLATSLLIGPIRRKVASLSKNHK